MKIWKRLLPLALIFAAVFLAGCARSDVVLTVNEDGSFTAQVSYGITKALMGNEEVQEQLKALVTDTLAENNIPYTESENDDYVVISVEREFENLAQLTGADAWQGMSFVPKFSSTQAQGSLWARYEDGRLKISGTLDSEAFQAKELLEQSGSEASFEGSLSIVLPEEAEEYGEALADGCAYTWSGNGSESKAVELVSAKMNSASDADLSDSESAAQKSAAVGIAAAVVAVAAILIVALILKRRKTESI